MKPKLLKGANDIYYIFPEENATILSKGKFSNVYIGARTSNNEKVICKQLKPDFALDKHHRLSFLVEASISVNHKGVAKNIDLIKEDANLYLIQEFILGSSLKNVLNTHSFTDKNNQKTAIKIIYNLLDAVDAIHQSGYAHCDIKPANIMICNPQSISEDNPDIKIIDFGLAKSITGTNFISDLKNNHFNILYSSPELILNKHYFASASSDIYSVGLVLYEMLCGKHSFNDDHPAKIIKHQLSSNVYKCSKIPKPVMQVIKKATAKVHINKSPYKYAKQEIDDMVQKGINLRYQSCNEMKADLEAIN